MKLNKKLNKGFTIIEVMIVLAIAGVIMGIVLIAVPNLQRNSRNNQLRADANNVLGYVADFVQSNNGTMPTAVCYDSASGAINMVISGTCTASATSNVGKIRPSISFSTGTTQPTATQTLVLALNSKCAGSSLPSTATTTNRAVAVAYVTETTGSTANACVEN